MSNWLPGAIAVPSSHDGGSMIGGEKKVTWHTYEAPYSLSAYDGAKRLIAAGNEVTLTFNPKSGQIAQMLPADRAGRGLRNPAGGVETNRDGSIHIQIEVIAYAAHPWTSDLTTEGFIGLQRIMSWLDSLGIPEVWPAGNPPSYPYGRSSRSTSDWNHSGHFGHAQVPENTHGDPGAISVAVLFGAAPVNPTPTPVHPAPKPPAPKPTSGYTSATARALQHAVHVGVDGKYGPATDKAVKAVRYAAYVHSYPWGTRYLQERVGTKADGIIGPNSRAALKETVQEIQRALHVDDDGIWGPKTDAAYNRARSALYMHY